MDNRFIDNELYHHGVLGMKWGVRNAETKARYARAEKKYDKNKSKIEKYEKRLDRNRSKMAKASRSIPTDISIAKFNRNHRATYRNQDKINKLNEKNEKLIRKNGEFLGMEYENSDSKKVKSIEKKVSQLENVVNKRGLTKDILNTTIPEIESLMEEYGNIWPKYEKYKFKGRTVKVPYKKPKALR